MRAQTEARDRPAAELSAAVQVGQPYFHRERPGASLHDARARAFTDAYDGDLDIRGHTR
eukprot:COSAG01_NODE_25797_length_732_cov_59.000000_1_plen_58_part_10